MKFLISFLCLFILLSCNQDIYKNSKKTYYKKTKEFTKELNKIEPGLDGVTVTESQNFNLRKPQFIIIHHTQQDSCKQTTKTFALERTGVSAHYVICKDGSITQMLNDYMRGWHAGKGKWYSITDMNSLSIGIELDNNGEEKFDDTLINSLIELLDNLVTTYGIPAENIIGHSDWAVGRKVDPNRYFPWEQLANYGFGIWYNEALLEDEETPENFDALLALKLLGYDITNPSDVFYAFKLHYNGYDGTSELNENDKKKLYLLVNGWIK